MNENQLQLRSEEAQEILSKQPPIRPIIQPFLPFWGLLCTEKLLQKELADLQLLSTTLSANLAW